MATAWLLTRGISREVLHNVLPSSRRLPELHPVQHDHRDYAVGLLELVWERDLVWHREEWEESLELYKLTGGVPGETEYKKIVVGRCRNNEFATIVEQEKRELEVVVHDKNATVAAVPLTRTGRTAGDEDIYVRSQDVLTEDAMPAGGKNENKDNNKSGTSTSFAGTYLSSSTATYGDGTSAATVEENTKPGPTCTSPPADKNREDKINGVSIMSDVFSTTLNAFDMTFKHKNASSLSSFSASASSSATESMCLALCHEGHPARRGPRRVYAVPASSSSSSSSCLSADATANEDEDQSQHPPLVFYYAETAKMKNEDNIKRRAAPVLARPSSSKPAVKVEPKHDLPLPETDDTAVAMAANEDEIVGKTTTLVPEDFVADFFKTDMTSEGTSSGAEEEDKVEKAMKQKSTSNENKMKSGALVDGQDENKVDLSEQKQVEEDVEQHVADNNVNKTINKANHATLSAGKEQLPDGEAVTPGAVPPDADPQNYQNDVDKSQLLSPVTPHAKNSNSKNLPQELFNKARTLDVDQQTAQESSTSGGGFFESWFGSTFGAAFVTPTSSCSPAHTFAQSDMFSVMNTPNNAGSAAEDADEDGNYVRHSMGSAGSPSSGRCSNNKSGEQSSSSSCHDEETPVSATEDSRKTSCKMNPEFSHSSSSASSSVNLPAELEKLQATYQKELDYLLESADRDGDYESAIKMVEEAKRILMEGKEEE
ncbi:unnamed protein product [Amoebophrya sp. A120]|nr:unnamed protein product [Amoebophrya sp. A120]|eukprot:GSA120T00006842001.1